MLPKQINPQKPEDTALAPYNFVPLNENVVSVAANALPDQDVYHTDRLHGVIMCTVTTETPLFVRGGLTPDEYARLDDLHEKDLPYTERVKNKPAFFSVESSGAPRIPGSTLRGMVRTLVEIVGYGKFERVTRNKLVYRSLGDITAHGDRYRDRIMQLDDEGYDERGRYQSYTPRVQAGYIYHRNNQWWIRPAQRIGGTTYARIHESLRKKLGPLEKLPGCKNAYRIFIQPGPWEYQMVRGGLIRIRYSKVERADARPGQGLIEGALATSGHMSSKRFEAVVFPVDRNAADILVEQEMVIDYLDQVSQEQESLLGEEGVLTRHPELEKVDASDGLPKHRQPVFYLLDEDGKLVFFGHTMMMRLPYPRSPHDLTPENLRNERVVDLAEAIFGYTKADGQGKDRAYAGRVFFSDARIDDADVAECWWTPTPITPRILATPKPTAFQHYLVQQYPDPEEYRRTRDGQPQYRKHLADYASAIQNETTLRGYKLYWHKGGGVTLDAVREPEEQRARPHPKKPGFVLRDSQYTQMCPVKPGVRFHFTIRFENLAREEVGALLWALTLPGPHPGGYRHKLGMGKPYGLGSVKLEAALRLEDRTNRYQTLFVAGADGAPRADAANTFAWASGERTLRADETTAELIAAFERHVVVAARLPGNAALTQQPRIKALLELLKWPGPPAAQTRYMEIERQMYNNRTGRTEKVNEYKDRKVLPTPAPEATAPPLRPSSETQRRPAPRPAARADAPDDASIAATVSAIMQKLAGGDQPAEPAPQQQAAPTPVKLSSKEEAQRGMYVRGVVVRVEPERVVIDLGVDEATLQKDEIVPRVRDRADMEERFPKGAEVPLWVRRINERGRIQLTMKRPTP